MVEIFQKSSYAAPEETKKQGVSLQFKQQQTQETPLIAQKMGKKRQKGIQVTPNEEEESKKVLETQEVAAVREFTMPQYQEEQAQILIAFSELKEEIKKLRIENRNLRTQIIDIQEQKESFMETYVWEQNGVFNEIGSVGKTVRLIGLAPGISDEADFEVYSQ